MVPSNDMEGVGWLDMKVKLHVKEINSYEEDLMAKALEFKIDKMLNRKPEVNLWFDVEDFYHDYYDDMTEIERKTTRKFLNLIKYIADFIPEEELNKEIQYKKENIK